MPSFTQLQPGAIKKTAGGYTYLDPAPFPADLPQGQAEFEARSQVLTAAGVFTAPMTVAAWKTKPSWAIVAGDDKIINPDLERLYYARAHSHTTELKGASHSVYESRPKEVAAVIKDAAVGALVGRVPGWLFWNPLALMQRRESETMLILLIFRRCSVPPIY
jgi:pimeloyl-ACP methyl ester carboxylesterase